MPPAANQLPHSRAPIFSRRATLTRRKMLPSAHSPVQKPFCSLHLRMRARPPSLYVGYPRPHRKGVAMSKADFIQAVAKEGKVSKADAKRSVELVFDAIASSLKGVKGGGRLQIGTFGTFVTSKRAARMGRNPRTGESIKIKASKSLRFKPSAQLKKAAGC